MWAPGAFWVCVCVCLEGDTRSEPARTTCFKAGRAGLQKGGSTEKCRPFHF